MRNKKMKSIQIKHFQEHAQAMLSSFSKTRFFCRQFINPSLSVEDRKELRKFLVRQIKALGFHKKKEFDFNPLLKIGSKPEHPFLALSIAHSKSLACFVLKDLRPSALKDLGFKKISIGLDIEEAGRASRQVVSRISLPEELEACPNPALLWTAKEAAFKCLTQKSLLLSDCFISNWKKAPFEKAYFFKAENKSHQKAKGIAFEAGSAALAYAETTTKQPSTRFKAAD